MAPARTQEQFLPDAKEIAERLVGQTTTVEGVPLHTEWEEAHQTAIALRRRVVGGSVEKSTCPFCLSLEVGEYTEPQSDITSVQKVAYDQVDNLIKQGYKVERMDAASAILVKKEVKA